MNSKSFSLFLFAMLILSYSCPLTAQTLNSNKPANSGDQSAQDARRNLSREIVLADDDKPAFPAAPEGYDLYRENIAHGNLDTVQYLSLIHISEPTRRTPISYAVFCLKKKNKKKNKTK